MHLTEWLLFLSQIPATPSSIRVNIWRKLRAAGALGLQNGVWVLPAGEEQRQFLESLLAALIRQGASGQILLTSSLNERVEADILARFRSDRDEEYHEFIDHCEGFLKELVRERQNEKYTFAELEESEQDLKKLKTWLQKIIKRDFRGDGLRSQAEKYYSDCRKQYDTFSRQVYLRQGVAGHSAASTTDLTNTNHEVEHDQ
jgi:DNA-binding transcriptional regulator PaaX